MMEGRQNREVTLQVLICTFGEDGIRRAAAGTHPKRDGVEYLVSWQCDPLSPVPAELEREDFKIFRTSTKGLSKNRNIALSKATAPLLLISDDDVEYTAEGLTAVIDAFEDNPDVDLLTFRYDCKAAPKYYPTESFSLANPPKGFFVSSIEIAFRRESVQGKVWFNENFGIGAYFPSGEEDIFINDCFEKGLKGFFVPSTIARHDGTTTSERNLKLASRPQTKGAVFLRLHPRSWPLRMLAHAKREIPHWRKGETPSPLSYCLNWLKGAYGAKNRKVFPTPDYSNIYCHDD